MMHTEAESQKSSSSGRKQKSNAGLIGGIVAAFAVTIGAVAAIFQAKNEKDELNEELKQNYAQCDHCFVEPEELVAEEGDLIEIQRDIYAHWAVYVGNGQVIHLVDYPNGKAQVLKQSLKDVAVGCVCRVNNLLKAAQKRGLISRDVKDILKAAYEKLNQTFDFHLINNNCEHYATECRYGKGFSEQAIAAEDKPIIGTFGPLLSRSSPIVAASIAKLANASNKQ